MATTKIPPVMARYCTELGFDTSMARAISDEQLICNISAKMNEVIDGYNELSEAPTVMSPDGSYWVIKCSDTGELTTEKIEG